jgi:ferredoxin
MRVTTRTDVCVGCGQCALAVPEVFDQQEDDGTVVLLETRPPAALHRRVRETAISCPVGAISTVES